MPRALRNGVTGFDHCIVGVHDLEAARERYARLGFTVTPRGRHVGWGTANYCIMFGADYVELLGIVDPGQFCNHLEDFLAVREGLLTVAFRTDDADATRAALAADGIDPEPVQDLGRILELPDREAMPRFRLVHLPWGATPGFKGFVCQHLDRDVVWQPGFMVHPNGALAVASYTLVSDDVAAAVEPYARLFGAGQVVWTDETLTVRTPRGLLLVCRPEDLEVLHPGADAPDTQPAPPYLAAMTVEVRALDRTTAALTAGQVPFDLHREAGVARVFPEDACGVLVEFREGR